MSPFRKFWFWIALPAFVIQQGVTGGAMRAFCAFVVFWLFSAAVCWILGIPWVPTPPQAQEAVSEAPVAPERVPSRPGKRDNPDPSRPQMTEDDWGGLLTANYNRIRDRI